MSSSYTLLIVDSSTTERQRLVNLFEKVCTCYEVSNAVELLDVLESRLEITAVLVNMSVLGGDGGLAFFQRLRSRNIPGASIPVVVLVEGHDIAVEVEAFRLGARDVVSLPYNSELLYARVMALMQHSVTATELMLSQSSALREQLQAHMLIAYHANFDPLTTLYRSKAFYANSALYIHARPDEEYVMAVLDVDRFKVINELFGPEVGDNVLQCIGNILRETARNGGVCGRLDADRFALCLPFQAFNPTALLDRLSQEINDLSFKHNFILHMGIFRVTDTTLTVNQMCDRARLALNSVKGNYMTRYAYYDSALRNTLVEEQELYAGIDAALEQRQFCIYYQPIFDAHTCKPISAEALIRWIHPQRGLISPGMFIPLFEKNDFISELDIYVWDAVCRFIQDSCKKNRPLVPISVNISRINFHNTSFHNQLLEILNNYDINPSMIKLEVTESAYTDDNSWNLAETIERLKTLGFTILMDDFGSGYSSLNMLKDVEVDVLKVDMRFLEGVEHSVRAAQVIASVIGMANRLHMGVIAEGVETEWQLNFLRDIGCDAIQGYYLAKPMPESDFIDLLNSHAADIASPNCTLFSKRMR